VLEVPHEGRGIKKADGCDTQTGIEDGSHALLEYQRRAEDSVERLRSQQLRLDFH
jgi:hypothetical protein